MSATTSLVRGLGVGAGTLVLVLSACSERRQPVAPRQSAVSHVARVEVTPAEDTLNALGGELLQLTATAYDADDNPVSAAFTFRSLDTARAYVDAAGQVTSNRQRGVARITAKAEGLTATSRILIRQVVKSVELTPEKDTINALGYTRQLATSPVDSNDIAVAGATHQWKSLNPGNASVSASGLVTAIKVTKAGLPARIQVTLSGSYIVGRSDSALIAVRQILKSIEITPSTANIIVGGTQQLTGAARDSNNATIPNLKFRWVALDPAVATVNPTAPTRSATTTVTGVATGNARVRAYVDAVADTVIVTVGSADAASHTWTGAAGSDFGTAGNWTPAFVPAATDTVVIASAGNQPLLGASATAASVIVQSGATFNIASNVLTLTNDLLVTGDQTMTTGHTLLAGTGAIAGNVSKLVVTGSYEATAATTVKGALEIQGGLLETTGQLIEIRQQ